MSTEMRGPLGSEPVCEVEVEVESPVRGKHTSQWVNSNLRRTSVKFGEILTHVHSWSYQLTQVYAGADPALQGVVLQADPGLSEWVDLRSSGRPWFRALLILRKYPLHFIHDLGYVIPPLAFALVPTVGIGLVTRSQADALPHFHGTMAELGMDPDLPSRLVYLNALSFNFVQIGFWGFYLGLMSTLWAWKVTKPVVLKVGLPFMVTSCAIKAFAGTVHLFGLPGRIAAPMYAVVLLWMLFGCYCMMRRAGKITNNPSFAPIVVTTIGIGMLIVLLYRNLSDMLFSGSHELKAFFIAVLNPVVFELGLITPSRFIARAVNHNDHSTSFLIVAMMLSFRHAIGRTVMAMIKDPVWVHVLSVLNAVCEVVLSLSMPFRDRTLYRVMFGRYLHQGELADGQMKDARNAHLRANNSMYESLSEHVFIWNGVALVRLLDVSIGGVRPSLQKLVRIGLIQTCWELAADATTLILAATFFRTNFLHHSRGRYWYWSMPTCCIFMFTSALTCESLASRVLCRSDPGSPSRWAVCEL